MSQITLRSGLSRQAADALLRRTGSPTTRTMKAIASQWRVERDWLEDGDGPSGLPLPPGLRAIVEDDPPPERVAAIIYAIDVGDGELLRQGASWSRDEWAKTLARFEVVPKRGRTPRKQ